jgi:hypothetical protein
VLPPEVRKGQVVAPLHDTEAFLIERFEQSHPILVDRVLQNRVVIAGLEQNRYCTVQHGAPFLGSWVLIQLLPIRNGRPLRECGIVFLPLWQPRARWLPRCPLAAPNFAPTCHRRFFIRPPGLARQRFRPDCSLHPILAPAADLLRCKPRPRGNATLAPKTAPQRVCRGALRQLPRRQGWHAAVRHLGARDGAIRITDAGCLSIPFR